MARIAVSKLRDPRVEVLCGDVEELAPPRRYDCCVVYNLSLIHISPRKWASSTFW